MTKNNMQFEKATERLDAILERMNSGTVSLDDSLALYEEADTLIASCQKRLNEAEQKIEVLIKNRQGDLFLDANDQPTVQNFMEKQ